jgi:hypothetical protein
VTIEETIPIASKTNAIGVGTRFISPHWVEKVREEQVKVIHGE